MVFTGDFLLTFKVQTILIIIKPSKNKKKKIIP